MADLISRSALIEYCNEKWIPLNVDAVKAQPTIEAEPIKHGRWEQDRKAVACSECDYHYISVGLPLHKYCPHCGAKMDLDEVENG